MYGAVRMEPCGGEGRQGLRARGRGRGSLRRAQEEEEEARLGCPGEAGGRAAAILPAGPAAAAARLTLAAAQRRSACVRLAAVTSYRPAGSRCRDEKKNHLSEEAVARLGKSLRD